MALSRTSAPARSCLRLLASAQGPAAPRQHTPRLAAALSTPSRPAVCSSVRCFSSSRPLLKKKNANDGSKDSDGRRGGGSKSSKSSSPSSSSSSSSSSVKPSAEDPLDFSAVIAAYAPIDAHFKSQLAGMAHGGRFNPTNLGSLPIAVKDADGDGSPSSFPLRELAQVVPRSGRTISLLVNDQAYIKPIMSAVQASREFNQQPQRSDDNPLELLLRIEAERKDDVARRVKEAVVQWRERIRQARAKHEKVLKDWKKSGAVLPDVAKRADKELQKLQDKKMKEIDGEEAQIIRQL